MALEFEASPPEEVEHTERVGEPDHGLHLPPQGGAKEVVWPKPSRALQPGTRRSSRDASCLRQHCDNEGRAQTVAKPLSASGVDLASLASTKHLSLKQGASPGACASVERSHHRKSDWPRIVPDPHGRRSAKQRRR